MTSKTTLLTGIKPTGMPHLGNYLGAIFPGLSMAQDYKAYFFVADYHALNTVKDPERLKKDSYEIAATWLACGLDVNNTVFYRQSRVPQISELMVILGNVTSKGLLNRSHAYKAIVQDNIENKRDEDKWVNMGLFNYPLLMSADILLFQADWVPVGNDQIQHVEIARDIAESFNSIYKGDYIKLPEAKVSDSKVVVGTDGRKMSKSYNNTLPLFSSEKKLRKEVMKIVTNSQGIEEPKNPDECHVFELFKNFASEEEQLALRERYLAGGMGWGDAKQTLFEAMNKYIQPMKEKYDDLMRDITSIDKSLERGEELAREVGSQNLNKIKKVIGIL